MTMALLDICIPTFNRAEYLEKCIASILAQDKEALQYIRILISDNNSSDETTAVVKRYKHPVIEYIRQTENLGAEKNVLFLADKSDTEFLMFLTDDSLLTKDALPAIIDILKRNPTAGAIFSPLNVINVQTEKVSFRLGNRQFETSAGRASLEKFLFHTLSLTRLIMRRSLFNVHDYEKHIGAYYPQMYLAGSVLCTAGAIYTPVVLVEAFQTAKIYWSYPPDFFSTGVVRIVRDLTRNVTDGNTACKVLIRERIRTSFSGLLAMRKESLKKYIKSLGALYAIPEYRFSVRFNLYALFFLIIGSRGFDLVNNGLKLLPRNSRSAARRK